MHDSVGKLWVCFVGLLSKPDGWDALRAAVSNQKRGAGRDKAARIFAELQAANHLPRRKRERKDGRFDWFSLLFEEAFVDLDGKTVPGFSANRTGKPTTVLPSSLNRQWLNHRWKIRPYQRLRDPKLIDPRLKKRTLKKERKPLPRACNELIGVGVRW